MTETTNAEDPGLSIYEMGVVNEIKTNSSVQQIIEYKRLKRLRAYLGIDAAGLEKVYLAVLYPSSQSTKQLSDNEKKMLKAIKRRL